MTDERGPMTVRGHRPGARGDRTTGRLLEGLVQKMVEMEAGRRSVHTLDPVASPLGARRIQRLVLTARAERNERPGTTRGRTTPIRVRTVSSFHPTAGVTEGVVLVRAEQRTRAYCVRLEQHGAEWRVVELAPPDTALRPVVTATSRAGRLIMDERDLRDGRRRTRRRIDGVDGPADTPVDAHADTADGSDPAEHVESRREGDGPHDGDGPATRRGR